MDREEQLTSGGLSGFSAVDCVVESAAVADASPSVAAVAVLEPSSVLASVLPGIGELVERGGSLLPPDPEAPPDVRGIGAQALMLACTCRNKIILKLGNHTVQQMGNHLDDRRETTR